MRGAMLLPVVGRGSERRKIYENFSFDKIAVDSTVCIKLFDIPVQLVVVVIRKDFVFYYDGSFCGLRFYIDVDSAFAVHKHALAKHLNLFIVYKIGKVVYGVYVARGKRLAVALCNDCTFIIEQPFTEFIQKSVPQPVGLIGVKQPSDKRRMFYFLPLHTYGVEDVCTYIFNRPDLFKFRA